ncbi:hypothetical protein JHK85_001260 [Glycine max]|nr:hypothetical protein JHK87_001233 [Glycine soja]KAG5068883.1 hypothetical protein JHK85_001260 [Glycine max]KAG5088612.1 hypothetical protein JHK86_001224 [Glycine max]
MIHDLIKDGGQISWSHSLREANQVVDCLAKFAHFLSPHIIVFDVIPNFTFNAILAYVIGTAFPRGF